MSQFPRKTPLYQLDSATIVLIVSALIIPLGATARGTLPNVTVVRANTAFQQLQRFKASHSLNDLQSATDIMFSVTDIDALTPQNFIAQRRTIVQGWAQILKVIEQSYDPTYDPQNPNDLPLICVQPPMQPTGVSPCADPKDVLDPNMRAAYVQAIHQNAEKAERAHYYNKLNLIDQGAMTGLQMSLGLFRKIAPDGASPDFAALDGILQRTGLSQARRTKIDAMFYARAAP